MLPFLPKKNISVVVGPVAPPEGSEADRRADDMALEHAAEEILSAIKHSDKTRLIEALRLVFTLVDDDASNE